MCRILIFDILSSHLSELNAESLVETFHSFCLMLDGAWADVVFLSLFLFLRDEFSVGISDRTVLTCTNVEQGMTYRKWHMNGAYVGCFFASMLISFCDRKIYGICPMVYVETVFFGG